MSSDRTDVAAQEPRLPEVDGARCTHALVVAASCSACVSACPRHAWVMGEESLALDTDACDGCAICAGACPQSAIAIAREPAMISRNDPGLALAACAKAVPAGGKGIMPCLNAIDRDELASLFASGVREVVVSRGACADCASSGGASFDVARADLQRMLASRKLPALSVIELTGSQWLRRREECLQPNRRAFFRSLAVMPGQSKCAEPGAASPAALVLPAPVTGDGAFPVAPVIAAGTCEACDACARICPTAAIRVAAAGDGAAAYAIDARACTGCRLCVDVCTVEAVSLVDWPAEVASLVPLRTRRCKSCGNDFRLVAAKEDAGALCRICATTGHNRKLFQVLP